VWPAQIAYRLITLHIINQILDIDLHRWTPVRGWDMGWHQCTSSSNSTTLESNMSVSLFDTVSRICRALILGRLQPRKTGNPIWHGCQSLPSGTTLRLVT